MDRQIACLYIPSFEIALARAQNAALRNRPVAVAPVHTSRALIREVSPEASAEGLQPGMSVELARMMCPALRIVPPDSSRVQAAHRELRTTSVLLCAGMGIHSTGLIVSRLHRHDTAFRSAHRYRYPHRTGTDPSPGMGERDRIGRQQARLAVGCRYAETAATSPLDSSRLGTAVSGPPADHVAPRSLPQFDVTDRPATGGFEPSHTRCDRLGLTGAAANRLRHVRHSPAELGVGHRSFAGSSAGCTADD